MLFMAVTLDVSKLSSWLNANARCRVERRACAMRVEVWAGRRGRVGRQQRTISMHGKRAQL